MMSNLFPRARQPISREDAFVSPRQNTLNTKLNRSLKTTAEVPEKFKKGTLLDIIINDHRRPPQNEHMSKIDRNVHLFMISPFEYDSSRPYVEPIAVNYASGYIDRWNANYVRMPCSPCYIDTNHQPVWPITRDELSKLKKKCDTRTATIEDLKNTILKCAGNNYDTYCLEVLITKVYSSRERAQFMSTTLSTICDLAMNVDTYCSRPPLLLRTGETRSVTMSQRQAASLLACSFFSLFPFRSDLEHEDGYNNFQDPNFLKLYQYGPQRKIEKLRCILHYFQRISTKMSTGVITFQRFTLPESREPKWSKVKAPLCPIHLTASDKIEDIDCTLQVDFANKYIGGGVLSAGCVQEEIRFSICPEMLVSLLLCEKMEPNECIFLIGCERYSTYKGYADSFEFAGNYDDSTPRDNWGRKWCHVVAMDAAYFRDRTLQFNTKCIQRDLLKAYTSFYPQEFKNENDAFFGIVTGNWGCGAFNGDRQLKAIIQLMAASAVARPLIYVVFEDKTLLHAFFYVYQYLLEQGTQVRDLYRYLERYCNESNRPLSLFEYILQTPIKSLY